MKGHRRLGISHRIVESSIPHNRSSSFFMQRLRGSHKHRYRVHLAEALCQVFNRKAGAGSARTGGRGRRDMQVFCATAVA